MGSESVAERNSMIEIVISSVVELKIHYTCKYNCFLNQLQKIILEGRAHISLDGL